MLVYSPMLLAITGISVTMFIHRQHKDACVMNQYVLFFSDGTRHSVQLWLVYWSMFVTDSYHCDQCVYMVGP